MNRLAEQRTSQFGGSLAAPRVAIILAVSPPSHIDVKDKRLAGQLLIDQVFEFLEAVTETILKYWHHLAAGLARQAELVRERQVTVLGANLDLAMPAPLTSEGQVTYGPGNPKPTVDQMAKDVSAFLIWTAEPKLEKRKQTGWPVLGFLLFATLLGYAAYRNVWRDTKH